MMRRKTVPLWPAADAAAMDTKVVDMVAQVADAMAEVSGAVVLQCIGMLPDVLVNYQLVDSYGGWSFMLEKLTLLVLF
jgi:hypothetical protein